MVTRSHEDRLEITLGRLEHGDSLDEPAIWIELGFAEPGHIAWNSLLKRAGDSSSSTKDFSSVAAFACNFLVSAVDISQSFAEWEPQIQTVVSTTSERIIRICYGIYIGPYIQIQTFDIVRSAVGTVELTYGTMIFLKVTRVHATCGQTTREFGGVRIENSYVFSTTTWCS
ncbi:hypothetical protein B0H13DRAFT_1924921 [Mycena leptocephala]|nr:hypothetical protein B0H13DRAFT_1924921 [Mycena leptocephala]